ncbi:DUF262 domain-containing protein [Qipengyuania sp. YG27]|uniref:DUF262 domain-containing protein n=1 Tax=Qipengyuania mesophila TaxID=2867246 RepID=A0ABS7JRB3_9SPHN|nr:DUF262 domain-containing protein [Qipengyuania mesophila]MBX7500146.1 DUF262 domain-containing protein [Qipengyuania mesophila]
MSDLLEEFRRAQADLVIQTSDLPLGALAGMVDEGAIDLQPGFQRRERWKPEKQSALIESFLLNVPVPPIYLSEERDGTFTAIDGKQRLRAVTDFMTGQLRLRQLDRIRSAEGIHFQDLPSEIQNSFRLRPFLRVVTLLKQTAPSLKYEVFLRLNRGGERLNAQEIRNVAYRGPLNDLIYELAQNDFLRERLKITSKSSSAYREMYDAEYVLRFLTLSRQLDDFSGSLVNEMDRFMREHQDASDATLGEFRQRFLRAIEGVEAVWHDAAFKRPEGDGWRDQALAGMYDAQMIAVDQSTDAQLENAINNNAAVIYGTRYLFENDEDFDKAVRTGTNTPARIRYRVDAIHTLMVN